jgi:hypothetical protein
MLRNPFRAPLGTGGVALRDDAYKRRERQGGACDLILGLVAASASVTTADASES